MSLFQARTLPDPDGVAVLTEALEDFLRGQSVDQRTRHHVLLGVEELLANLHDHAGAADRPAEVTLTVEPARVLAEILDTGTPFDPREAPPPDLEAELADRDIGGLGLHLLRTLAEGLDYERRDGANLTRFWFRRG
jgi:anti-sigma regulatory factor (Ser/Thr protein kinase)